MTQAQPKVRDAALSFELKPEDNIDDFVTNAETKMRVGKGATALEVASMPSSTDPNLFMSQRWLTNR